MGCDSGMEDGYLGYRLQYDDPEHWKKLYEEKCEEVRQYRSILATTVLKLNQLSKVLEEISNV